ncbi:hypothetical protein [Paenibacillus methanolicus]|uniref:Uncharacterized protein n=1 Tax=Paenibacillus methanolicus TaxID=582686 RepID=A0A5S5C857_9BACL|nr:hypothetical protein [Paenibacillus methanolicus]TYP75524.1 hypothetical protein BCM02_104202 [Paenibacillus methanolicus]
MTRDKWFKWKIAMAGTAGMAFLFHVIKTSPDYEAAVSQNAAVPAAETAEESQDPVWQEWLSGVETAQPEAEIGGESAQRRGRGEPGFDTGGQGWQGSDGDAADSRTWDASGDAARTGRS